ncbi:protein DETOXIFICATION 14-like [Arachis duranensis]|uniref:Protein DETOXIFICATION 14-like n=1 Tax=Arachis duranensis TaxID=130453 RepID=A0A9C6TY18_ARADU|nr:protein DETOXIFICATION 14-like [Arachis duranensis]
MLFSQDPAISHAARAYCIHLIPALFGYAVLQSLIRYFQTQSMIFPMVFTSIASLCMHVPICWFLVFKSGMGHVGAALAIGISYWINVIALGFYIQYSSACSKTKIVFSRNALLSIAEFFQYAIPSGLMFCFEWWSFELLTLLAGLLPNPQLETSVLSVCTRVSNELGAGNPKSAQGAVRVVVIIGIAEAFIVSTFFIFFRNIVGYAYSNDEAVVDYVASMVPLLCMSVSADSIMGTLSGVARGAGFQQIGAYVNLGAYYLVGVPLALFLGFHQPKAKGLWMGMISGSCVQVIILAVVTALTDWQKEAENDGDINRLNETSHYVGAVDFKRPRLLLLRESAIPFLHRTPSSRI